MTTASGKGGDTLRPFLPTAVSTDIKCGIVEFFTAEYRYLSSIGAVSYRVVS